MRSDKRNIRQPCQKYVSSNWDLDWNWFCLICLLALQHIATIKVSMSLTNHHILFSEALLLIWMHNKVDLKDNYSHFWIDLCAVQNCVSAREIILNYVAGKRLNGNKLSSRPKLISSHITNCISRAACTYFPHSFTNQSLVRAVTPQITTISWDISAHPDMLNYI